VIYIVAILADTDRRAEAESVRLALGGVHLARPTLTTHSNSNYAASRSHVRGRHECEAALARAAAEDGAGGKRENKLVPVTEQRVLGLLWAWPIY
jgi:hypothetical protein